MKPSRAFRRVCKADFRMQPLEPRCLLSATLIHSIPHQSAFDSLGPTTVNLSKYFDDPIVPGTAVEIQTSEGNIPLALTDAHTPLTVKNFLDYINAGEYADTIIHRSVPGFVIQGGGYTAAGELIPQFAPVEGEPGYQNTTGTIAMALSNGPNSGTSQWFINLANNNGTTTGHPNLDDTSDGGPFTVFGEVIYGGMSVVDAIANLTVVNDSAQNAAWTALPVTAYTGANPATSVPAADMVTSTTVVVQPLTYTAVSSNADLVTASVSNGTLTLTPVAGQSGDATVTVTATDLGSGTATSSFDVSVSDGSTLAVAIGAGQLTRSVAYTDPDGTAGTITLKGPGDATVNFAGSGITDTTAGGVVNVTGSGVSIPSITASGTTAQSVLTISTRGGTRAIDVGSILVDSLRSLAAPGVTLTGNLTSSGSIGALSLAGANGGVVSATSIGNFAITGVFSDNLTLDAGGIALHHFSAGSISDGTWGITGSVGTIAAHSITGWNAGITQSVRSVVVSHGNLNGTFTAGSVGSFIVRGNVQNSTVEVSSAGVALRLLSVLGAIAGSTVNSIGGNIGSVVAGSLLNSEIYAGVGVLTGGQVLPLSASDFSSSDAIGAVILRQPASGDSFTNSDIAAARINTLSLGSLATANGGNPTGVASEHIRLLAARANKTFTLTNLTSATNLTAILAARGLQLEDFLISLF